jgi:hypothetical protein
VSPGAELTGTIVKSHSVCAFVSFSCHPSRTAASDAVARVTAGLGNGSIPWVDLLTTALLEPEQVIIIIIILLTYRRQAMSAGLRTVAMGH